MANSSSKYPIPPPRGRSTKSTITRERSDAPPPPRPEQEFYQGQGEWGPVQTTRYKNTPSRDLRRNDYDPWKAGREHDAKQGVEATGDEMLPFTAVAGLPAARLIPAAVRGVVGAGKYAAAPAAEMLRRGGERIAQSPMVQTGTRHLQTANSAMDKVAKHPVYKGMSDGGFSPTGPAQGPNIVKAPYKMVKNAYKALSPQHKVGGPIGGVMQGLQGGIPMAYDAFANNIGSMTGHDGRQVAGGGLGTGPKF